jgi:hypothetical protein
LWFFQDLAMSALRQRAPEQVRNSAYSTDPSASASQVLGHWQRNNASD